MKLNGIDEIKKDGGDFLVLRDVGEITIESQHKEVEKAVSSVLAGHYDGAACVVQIVDTDDF